MVKNFGGKHGKKIARKNAHSNSEGIHNKKMRFANGDEELYGLVTKCLGNGQFLIICNDQVERLCILRNKFTGRNKQSNIISIRSWVIVGLRSWETTKPNKKEKCDMLEVYTNNERHRLLEECKVNLTFLSQQENLLLNIDEQEEQTNAYVTFSEGGVPEDGDDGGVKTHQQGGGDGSHEMEQSDNFEDEIDIDEI
uniref:S1-like domain-containing protein n=1 Tax=viral metagenome TaxID=1070528 RepID=A0A6C0L119_9ZZZZ|tara:strand:- start:11520 stop:12107 length:588 start_codon:yes stop_codon:yes gene_type:complete